MRAVSSRLGTTEGVEGAAGGRAVHFTSAEAKKLIEAELANEGDFVQWIQGRCRPFAILEVKLPIGEAARRTHALKDGLVPRSKSAAEVLVNADEVGPASWRYGALKLWFDRGGTVMTRGPGLYEISSGKFLPGMKLVTAADGAQTIVPMSGLDKLRFVGHDATLSFIGWSPLMPPANVGGVYLYYDQELPRGR